MREHWNSLRQKDWLSHHNRQEGAHYLRLPGLLCPHLGSLLFSQYQCSFPPRMGTALLTVSTLPSVTFFLSSLKHLSREQWSPQVDSLSSPWSNCKKCVSVDGILFIGCQGFIKRDHTVGSGSYWRPSETLGFSYSWRPVSRVQSCCANHPSQLSMHRWAWPSLCFHGIFPATRRWDGSPPKIEFELSRLMLSHTAIPPEGTKSPSYR